MYGKQIIIFGFFVMFLLMQLSVVYGAGSVNNKCNFDANIIKCTPIVCEGSRFTRICIDTTGCINDGKEFEKKGACQSVYEQKPRQTESEKKVSQFVNYDDEFPSINEENIELISADLISGESEIKEYIYENNLLFNEVEIPAKVDGKEIPIVPYLIAVVLLSGALFVFVIKRRTQFSGFSNEIRKLK